MVWLRDLVVSVLVWLSSDPQQIALEGPKAAAAVRVAYARFAPTPDKPQAEAAP